MSCKLLFNLTLEIIIRKLDSFGCIHTQSFQIYAFTDDIAITCRNKMVLTETTVELKQESCELSLNVNEGKTKYMKYTKSDRKAKGRQSHL